MRQKELIELLEEKTKEINSIVENKETFSSEEIKKITSWLNLAIQLIETFKKTSTNTYKFLTKLSENTIKAPTDIKNAVQKFTDFLEYIRVEYKNLSTTQSIPIAVEKENGSYWDKI